MRRYATGLLAIPAILLFLSTCAFAAGASVAPWFFPAAVISGAALTTYTSRRWTDFPLFLLVILLFTSFAGLLYDSSYDSCGYHQEAIAWFAEGWNPFRQTLTTEQVSPWVIHYAKFVELMEACIVSTTRHIETGKAFNFILITATLLEVYSLIRTTASRRRAILVTLVAASCPVMVAQAPTFYIDYTLYCYLLLSLASMIRLWRSPKDSLALCVLVFTLLMAIGTKFNIFFYIAFAWLAWLVMLLWHHRNRLALTTIIAGILTVAAGCLLFFRQPYLTNLLHYGNPLYPLLGGGVDIMSSNTSDIYTSVDNRFLNFFINLFGIFAGGGRDACVPSTDTRIGGYGLFMPILIGIYIWAAISRRRSWPAAAYYVSLIALISCFFFEQSWWARYNPQLWLLPLTVVTVGDCRKLSFKLTVLFAALTLITCGGRFLYNLQNRGRMHHTFDGVREVKVLYLPRQQQMKFREHGIRAEIVDSLSPDSTIYLVPDYPIQLQ